jgi:hypothetical protein
MLAGGDEDLLAGNLVAAVTIGYRLGAQQAEIGAAMRFGEVHGSGPCALDHPGQPCRLLVVRAVDEDGGNRTLGQPRIHH